MGGRGALVALALAAAFAAVLSQNGAVSYAWHALTNPDAIDWGQVGSPPRRRRRPPRAPIHLNQRSHVTDLNGCSTRQAPPWPLFALGNALASRWLPQLQAALLPPHLHVAMTASAFVQAKGGHAPCPCQDSFEHFSHLRPAKRPRSHLHRDPADLLQQHGPMPAAALASRLNVKEDALARVLRCLSAHGVFKEVGGRMLPRALLTHRTTPTAADATHSASCRIPPTDLSWHVCQQPRQQRAAR